MKFHIEWVKSAIFERIYSIFHIYFRFGEILTPPFHTTNWDNNNPLLFVGNKGTPPRLLALPNLMEE